MTSCNRTGIARPRKTVMRAGVERAWHGSRAQQRGEKNPLQSMGSSLGLGKNAIPGPTSGGVSATGKCKPIASSPVDTNPETRSDMDLRTTYNCEQPIARRDRIFSPLPLSEETEVSVGSRVGGEASDRKKDSRQIRRSVSMKSVGKERPSRQLPSARNSSGLLPALDSSSGPVQKERPGGDPPLAPARSLPPLFAGREKSGPPKSKCPFQRHSERLVQTTPSVSLVRSARRPPHLMKSLSMDGRRQLSLKPLSINGDHTKLRDPMVRPFSPQPKTTHCCTSAGYGVGPKVTSRAEKRREAFKKSAKSVDVGDSCTRSTSTDIMERKGVCSAANHTDSTRLEERKVDSEKVIESAYFCSNRASTLLTDLSVESCTAADEQGQAEETARGDLEERDKFAHLQSVSLQAKQKDNEGFQTKGTEVSSMSSMSRSLPSVGQHSRSLRKPTSSLELNLQKAARFSAISELENLYDEDSSSTRLVSPIGPSFFRKHVSYWRSRRCSSVPEPARHRLTIANVVSQLHSMDGVEALHINGLSSQDQAENQCRGQSLPASESHSKRRLSSNLQIDVLREHFIREGLLTEDCALLILRRCAVILKMEPNLLFVRRPAVVVGSLHGKLYDLLMIMASNRLGGDPMESSKR